jgi:hypothetical protein
MSTINPLLIFPSSLSTPYSPLQDTLQNSEAQMKQLEDLQRNLAESGELIRSYESIIQERESLLRDLQTRRRRIFNHEVEEVEEGKKKEESFKKLI